MHDAAAPQPRAAPRPEGRPLSGRLGTLAVLAAKGVGALLLGMVALLLLFTAVKLMWMLFTSPLQYFGLLWRGFVAAFRDALQWLWPALPYVLWATAAGLLAVLAVAAVVLLAASRRNDPPRVFVSYHHAMRPVVADLARHLGARLTIVALPFETAPQHDALLDRILDAIRDADFVVTLPGPQPSFVDHEVLAAATRRVPIALVLPQDHAGSPNTAHRSYPAFRLEELQRAHWQPLGRFIEALHGGRRQVWTTLTRIGRPPAVLRNTVIAAVVACVLLALAAGIAIGVQTYYRVLFVDVAQGVEAYGARYMLLPALLVLVALLLVVSAPALYLGGLVVTFAQRQHALRLVARKIRDGGYAPASFGALDNLPEFGEELRRCLYPEAPQPYHERQRALGATP